MNRNFFLLVTCALGIQVACAAPTQQVLVVTNTQANAHEASASELLSAGAKKLGKTVVNTAQSALALATAWSCGRQYQLARTNGLTALVSHPDSWPQWLWTNHSSLCLTAFVAASSYVGYKLYTKYAVKPAPVDPGVPAKPGMAHAETQFAV